MPFFDEDVAGRLWMAFKRMQLDKPAGNLQPSCMPIILNFAVAR